MPRKQNGFGPSASFGFKKLNPINKGKGFRAAGSYPSNRRYGTAVTRSVIEKWNLESDWQRWRKGYEIYSLASFARLNVLNPFYDPGLPGPPENPSNPEFVPAELESILYQGTGYEYRSTFDGYEFPTANSDVNTHYVAVRRPEFKSLGFVTQVQNDPEVYPKQKEYGEIWVKGVPDATNARLMLQMPMERLTDGPVDAAVRTEATVKTILDENDRPAIYRGITAPKDIQDTTEENLTPTTVSIRVPLTDLVFGETEMRQFRANQGLSPNRTSRIISQQEMLDDPEILVGKLVYIENFFQEKPTTALDAAVWADADQYAAVVIVDAEAGQNMRVYDPGVQQLPPAMYDLDELPTLFTSSNANYTLQGTYVFDKSKYQRYFGTQYLTADLIESLVTDMSYSVLPFTIEKAAVVGGELRLESVPFQSEVKFYPPLTVNSTIVFGDKSFVEYTTDADGVVTVNPNIDPWYDEVFQSSLNTQSLMRIANLYTCSCPAHAKAIIAAPQKTQGADERKINRQRNYPLPTATGLNRFDGAGIDQSAGKLTRWESNADRLKFKMCKHTVAAMFFEGLRVIEPNTVPTAEARAQFEDKLQIQTVSDIETFKLSFVRSGISLQEIIFALADGLNLDNVETAYVILNGD